MGKIMIDPGHGGHDPGAVGPTGKQEKDVTLSVAFKLLKLFQTKQEVHLTRCTDVFIPLHTRAVLANSWKADLFLSIHCNGFKDPSAHGFEVYTSRGTTPSDIYAKRIATNWQQVFPDVKFRGVKEAGYVVLVNTAMPAVLIELDFITNPEMEKKLVDEEYQEIMAKTIYDAI